MSENDSDVSANATYAIPLYDDLRKKYDGKWLEEKEKFQNQLKENFQVIISQFRTGRQVVYELTESQYSEQYQKAFRELFSDTGYQATIGEVERLGSGNKKSRKLIVRMPDCYNGSV
jgi:hypothetical protein